MYRRIGRDLSGIAIFSQGSSASFVAQQLPWPPNEWLNNATLQQHSTTHDIRLRPAFSPLKRCAHNCRCYSLSTSSLLFSPQACDDGYGYCTLDEVEGPGNPTSPVPLTTPHTL